VPQSDTVGQFEIGASNHTEASRGVSRPTNVLSDLVEVDIEAGNGVRRNKVGIPWRLSGRMGQISVVFAPEVVA